MNSKIRNNEIMSMNNNKNNIWKSYQNDEDEKSVIIDKYVVESFLDKINKNKL